MACIHSCKELNSSQQTSVSDTMHQTELAKAVIIKLLHIIFYSDMI